MTDATKVATGFVAYNSQPMRRHGVVAATSGLTPDLDLDYGNMSLPIDRSDWRRESTAIRNRSQLLTEVGLDGFPLVLMWAQHGNNVFVIDSGSIPSSPRCDALITNQPGVVIGLLHADCLPIVLHDQEEHILAVVHAGLKGTVLNIAGRTLHVMRDRFGVALENVVAYLGASICANDYPRDRTPEEDAWMVTFKEETGLPLVAHDVGSKYHPDIEATNRAILERAGVTIIDHDDRCTFEHPEELASARGLDVQFIGRRPNNATIAAMID